MAYIGRDTDKISNIEKLDTITFDGSSSYTLQKNSVNFTPNSANSLQVSIDGVVQAGNFTVSGSVIDFGVAIPATSTNDFIFHYGTGLVTTVSDGAITTAKLGDASVTSAKLSGVTQGITEADQWRLTANITTNADITSNLERVDNASFGYIGTGMSESSGIFSFPSTGLWMVRTDIGCTLSGDDNVRINVYATTDNSSYDLIAYAFGGGNAGSTLNTANTTNYINVTDVSNVKVKFNAGSIGSGSAIAGETTFNYSSFTFIRLGDSQ